MRGVKPSSHSVEQGETWLESPFSITSKRLSRNESERKKKTETLEGCTLNCFSERQEGLVSVELSGITFPKLGTSAGTRNDFTGL